MYLYGDYMKLSKLELANKTKYTNIQSSDIYGGWQIIDGIPYITKNRRQGNIYFLCKCVYCNLAEDYTNIQVLKKYKLSGGGGCLSCVRKNTSPIGNDSPLWKGVGELPMAYVHNLRGAATRRNIQFDITPEYMWKLFVEQDRMCKLSGVELSFRPRTNERTGTASLDRINRDTGYVEGNVQWVHKIVNEMKWAKTDEELIYWCNIISKFNSK
jgi:hypothetical protein